MRKMLLASLIENRDTRSSPSMTPCFRALSNYRIWHLCFVNQSTLRYDNSSMNNICAVGIVRAYLSSNMHAPSNRSSHTGYWLSRKAIIVSCKLLSMLQFQCAAVCFSLYAQMSRIHSSHIIYREKFPAHVSLFLYYKKSRAFNNKKQFFFIYDIDVK